MNRGYRPVTGHSSGGKPYRVEGRLNIKELISRTRCRICREKGHWSRECPNKGKQMLRSENILLSLSISEEITAHQATFAKVVIDTGCSHKDGA